MSIFLRHARRKAYGTNRVVSLRGNRSVRKSRRAKSTSIAIRELGRRADTNVGQVRACVDFCDLGPLDPVEPSTADKSEW